MRRLDGAQQPRAQAAALRAWQRTQGLPADGYPTPAMLTTLQAP